jgi:Ser/Thr protein kinase RdoA (MazF antagonist)
VSGGGPPTRHPAVRRLAELATTARNASRLAAGARLVDGQALESLPAEAAECLRDAGSRVAVPAGWRLRDRLTTVGDVAVLELVDGPDLAGVLKLARTPAGDDGLLQQQDTLQQLAGDGRLGPWRRLLPDVLASGVVEGRRYSVERALPGTVASDAPAADAAAGSRTAVRAIAELHRTTGGPAVASRTMVDDWLQPALSLIAELPTLLGPGRRRRLVDRLRDRIRTGAEGRTVWLGRTHGDFFPGNVFLGPSGEVSGIIDWAQSRTDDPAVIDLMTYLLVVRAGTQGTGLGSIVRDLCRGAPLTGDEQALVELHRAACPADPIDPDVMALLAWLRHAENNLLKSPRYAADPAWVFLNVERVLKGASGD